MMSLLVIVVFLGVAHSPVPGTGITPQVQDGKLLASGPDFAYRSGFYSPHNVLTFLELISHT